MIKMNEIFNVGNSCKVSELIEELRKFKPEDVVSVGAYSGMGKLVVNKGISVYVVMEE